MSATFSNWVNRILVKMNVTDNACTMDSGVASTFDHIQDNSTRHNLSHFLRLHDLYTSCYTNFKFKLLCPSIREIEIWYSFSFSLSSSLSVTLISFIVARNFPTWQMFEYNWINSAYGMVVLHLLIFIVVHFECTSKNAMPSFEHVQYKEMRNR